MSADEAEPEAEADDEHLDGIDSGCGCAEVWEQLSEQREGAEADD